MLVIPAIDLKDGQCVRLRQGRMEDATVFGDDPVAVAGRWVAAGARRLHLVDLDGAFAGEPRNASVVTAIHRAWPELPLQIGGGIRRLETIEAYLEAGVSWVIVGTRALEDPAFVDEACQRFPGRVIAGIDALNGKVATDGWAQVSDVEATDLARRLAESGVSAVVYTDIHRDGMMSGCNVEATARLARDSGLPVIASGGISSLEDVQAVRAASDAGIVGVISGRALYEGSLDLAAAQAWCDAQGAD